MLMWHVFGTKRVLGSSHCCSGEAADLARSLARDTDKREKRGFGNIRKLPSGRYQSGSPIPTAITSSSEDFRRQGRCRGMAD